MRLYSHEYTKKLVHNKCGDDNWSTQPKLFLDKESNNALRPTR